MSLAKKNLLLGGVSALAAGGVGAAWMFMGGFSNNIEPRKTTHVPTRPKRSVPVKPTEPPKPKEEVILPEETEEPVVDIPELPQEPEPEEPEVEQTTTVVTPTDPKEPIIKAGLDCSDVTEEIDCNVGEASEINVEWNGKKGTYEPSEDDSGTFKLQISEDLISGKTFSFTITEKPITLKNKSNPDETITLERYENYGLEKDDSTGEVYLKRRLTANQGKIRSLGLPNSCSLPTEVSTELPKVPTCVLTKNQIRSVNFEGKKEGGATSKGNVNLYIQKVSDETTYKGGYKFTFKPEAELEINEGDKIKGGVLKDFMMKDPTSDDLVLEKVWKSENQLLSKFGLTCGEDNKCTIDEGHLKINKKNRRTFISIKDGGRKKKDSEKGEIYLVSKDAPGYYEGLLFTVWGEGGVTIESKSNPNSYIKMEELEIYYITKEEKDGSSYYYLNVKDGGVEEMISKYLRIYHCAPSAGLCEKICKGNKNHLWNYRFHDGEEERTVTVDNDRIPITIVISSYQKDRTRYPFGHKFTINPERDIALGKITLRAKTDNNFKIKKDIANKKLYLVEDK